MLRFVVVIASLASIVDFALEAAPTGGNSAMLYLSQFGYLNVNAKKGDPGKESIIDISNAVAEFQNFAGLNVTGELDDDTLNTMSLSRCGVKDIVGSGSDSRSKRYALQGSRWKVKSLSFRISKYPRKLAKNDVDREIQKAFNVWSGHTDLTFRPVKTNPHIDIRFESGEHGDGDPFDGPGGTLAHAYFPVYGGDAHFDATEQWTIDSFRGTNLFQVAAHEFGHSLGLSHSDVRSALMSPFYRGYEPVFSLDEDDVLGIQALYGKKTSFNPPPSDDDDDEDSDSRESANHPNNIPKGGGGGGGSGSALCRDPKFDTILTTADGDMYVLKGDQFWHLKDDKIMADSPRKIKEHWIGLEGNIDAAFTYKNGKTYFFKGSKYWRYSGRKMDGVYPKPISEGFTGIPDNIDAATVWSGNGKIYFYKGSKFWRFDPAQRPPVKSTYPKPLANWEGVPDNLDAAFKDSNGYTYFFKDGAYYRFNDQAFAVDIVDPAFPRSTANWWFGCKEAPRGTIGTAATRGWQLAAAAAADNSSARGGSDSRDVAGTIFNDAGLHQGSGSTNEDEKSAAASPRGGFKVLSPILVVLLTLTAILAAN